MEILSQSTKTMTPRPYTHLGYIAATPSSPHWGFFSPGLLLLLTGLALSLKMRTSKTKRGFTSISLHLRKDHKYIFSLGLVLLVLSLPFLFLGWVHRTDNFSHTARAIISRVNLRGIYTAMEVYAAENKGHLPLADQWCDLLIVHMDVSPVSFTIPHGDIMLGESAYAMNEYIKGIPFNELQPDIVLLFQTGAGIGTERSASTKDRNFHGVLEYREDYSVYPARWNQIAGPDSIQIDHYRDPGAFFLFGDGRIEFLKPEDFPTLRWKPSERDPTEH